jgi:hypothetical protein
MPYFNFGCEDSDGPTPYSWRFGQYRRWHPDLNLLYEIKSQNGGTAWASCLAFTDEEQKNLVSRPCLESQSRQPDCIEIRDRISRTGSEPAEPCK